MLVHWNWNDSDGLIHSIPNRKKKKLEFSLKICIKRTMFHLALMLASHMLTGVGVIGQVENGSLILGNTWHMDSSPADWGSLFYNPSCAGPGCALPNGTVLNPGQVLL